MYAGLQFVMPNETAPAHRHTAFAMRFIIEGNGGCTAVRGRRNKMNEWWGCHLDPNVELSRPWKSLLWFHDLARWSI